MAAHATLFIFVNVPNTTLAKWRANAINKLYEAMKTEVSVEQNATLKDNAFAALLGVSPGALSLLLVEARDGSQVLSALPCSSDERFLGPQYTQ